MQPSAQLEASNAATAETNGGLISIGDAQVSGCGLPDAMTSATDTATGTGVSLDGRPMTGLRHDRVVNVAIGAGESIAALGFARSLVGRDIASGGGRLRDIAVVTDGHAVNAERVLAARPTLVIADEQSGPSTALKQIIGAGVPVVKIPRAWTLTDVQPKFAALAAAFGEPKRTAQLLRLCRRDVAPTTQTGPRVAFLYLRGSAAIYLVGGRGSGADALIAAAGATDVGARAGLKPFTALTPETLSALKPDILLVMTKGLASVGGVNGLRNLAGVSQTPAAKRGAVVAVDDSLLLAFDSRTWALIAQLRRAFGRVS